MEMEKVKELCFICRKCTHHLFVDEKPGWVRRMKTDCPNCGEEGDQNWILRGYGDFRKENP